MSVKATLIWANELPQDYAVQVGDGEIVAVESAEDAEKCSKVDDQRGTEEEEIELPIVDDEDVDDEDEDVDDEEEEEPETYEVAKIPCLVEVDSDGKPILGTIERDPDEVYEDDEEEEEEPEEEEEL